jgi:hypothetical protein
MMTSQELRPIMVGEPFEHEGHTLITAQVTLSVEDWKLLVETEMVGMFEADTLQNRIKSLLFWNLTVEAGNRRPISGEDWSEIERQSAEPSSPVSSGQDEDVPF